MPVEEHMKITTGLSALFVVAALALLASTGAVKAEEWHGDDMRRFHDRDEHAWQGGRWFQGEHDGRRGSWWIVGDSWYFYPQPVYPYPDPYVPSVMPAPQPGPALAYWYYCANPAGYYPYVPACSTNWQAVPASPG
jgi:hypothetical protein